MTKKAGKKVSYLLLKWGSLKDWSGVVSPKAKRLIKQWGELGVSMSAIMHRDTDKQKELICKIIDECDVIQEDWGGKILTKKQAKKYVTEYRRNPIEKG